MNVENGFNFKMSNKYFKHEKRNLVSQENNLDALRKFSAYVKI